MDRNDLTYAIRGAAFAVHSALGPGLMESAYEVCMIHELRKRGFSVRSQVILPILYDGVTLNAGYRVDLIVGDEIIVELKAVEKLQAVHTAQLLTYLKLARKPIGLLMNFHVKNMQHGIHRYILERALREGHSK